MVWYEGLPLSNGSFLFAQEQSGGAIYEECVQLLIMDKVEC